MKKLSAVSLQGIRKALRHPKGGAFLFGSLLGISVFGVVFPLLGHWPVFHYEQLRIAFLAIPFIIGMISVATLYCETRHLTTLFARAIIISLTTFVPIPLLSWTAFGFEGRGFAVFRPEYGLHLLLLFTILLSFLVGATAWLVAAAWLKVRGRLAQSSSRKADC